MPATLPPRNDTDPHNIVGIIQHARSEGQGLVVRMPRGMLVVADSDHLKHEHGTIYSLAGTAEFDLSNARNVKAVDPAELEPRSYYAVTC